MRRRSCCAALALLVLLGVAARAAASDPERRRLYAKRADLFVDGEGLARLALPAEVLAQCQQDGADLLVLDAQGAEVPYAFDSGADLDQVREVVETAPAQVLESVRGETSDAAGERFFFERFDVARPPATLPGTTLHLLVEAGRRGTLQVEAAMSARQPSVVWSPPTIDLAAPAAGDWGREIELPAESAERITVTLRGRDPRAAPPVMLFRSVRVQVQERVRMQLEVIEEKSEGGATHIDLARPAGWRLDALEIETSSPAFSRKVAVFDVLMHRGSNEVGRATLSRIGDLPAAEPGIIPLAALHGERLRVSIRNADSPPLADLRVFAVVRRPALVFPVRGASAGRAGTLLFGGGRVRRPRYDLQEILTGADEQARAGLFDTATLLPARLGPPQPNPEFEARPLLRFAMQPGAAIDAAEFRYRRRVEVPAVPDGLSRFRLAAEDIARARRDLGDVRVVDADGRQWPHVLQRGEAEEWLEVGWEPGPGGSGQSRMSFAPPIAPLPVDRLALRVATEYFQRSFELVGYDSSGQVRTLARGTLRSDVGEAAPIEIAFAETLVERLELAIDDGDEAPLRLRQARLRFTAATVFLVAPAGAYTLLLGNAEAEPPRYDLAGVRDLVLSVASAAAQTGALEENPDYLPPLRRVRSVGWWKSTQKLLMWGFLIAAVAILGVLTLRQVRGEPGSGS